MSLEAMVAVLLDRTASIAEDVTEMKRAQSSMVPRTEWMLRNTTVDDRFQTQGREISQLRSQATADAERAQAQIAQVANRGLSWTSVLTAIVAAAGFTLALLNQLYAGGTP